MTEKRDLNNELILMKKTIQQAKVCVIGKLVRKLKNLTDKQGKELAGLKLIGKRARLTDQINFLKKTPNLELATSALTFDKNPSKILTNQLSSIEDASLASIISFKTVGVKINQIKAKFGLNDNTDDWRDTVTGIGKKKKKKIERETNKTRNKERKEAHKKSRELIKKRDEWLEENLDATDESSGIDEEEKAPTSSGDSRNGPTIVVDKKKQKIAKKKPVNDPLKTADPFFLTGTGETYYATKIIDRIQPTGPNDGLDRKGRRAQQFGSGAKTIKRKLDPPAESSRSSMKSVEGLHPSWAAKMKSKGIDEFKGKKMKFNDSDDGIKSNGTIQAVRPNDDEQKIHPSWAAKQKLKPIISEFKGSKIVFDD